MVRNITVAQYSDQMEWLEGAAAIELGDAHDHGGDVRTVVAVLDDIKRCAAECAKFLRGDVDQALPIMDQER